MELAVLLYSGLILVISLLTIRLLHTLLANKNGGDQPLPPGELGLPLVGESLKFWSSFKAGISEKFVFERMAKHSPVVFKTSLMAETMAFVCGSAGSKFLFSNENKLVKQWWPPVTAALFGPTRRSPFPTRSVVIMFYRSADGISKKVGVIDRLAKSHLETKWHGRQEVTVRPLVKNFSFTVGCSLALSMEDSEPIEKLQTLLFTILASFNNPKINLPGTAYNRSLKAWNAARKQVSEIVTRRRTTELLETAANHSNHCDGYQDTLSSLLEAIRESGEEMSDVDIADRLIGLLVVIHDTSSVVLTMFFKYLGKHPQVYDAVRQENMEVAAAKKRAGEMYLNWDDIQKMKYTWNVIREVLRLFPTNPVLLREALVDFSYGGFHIPKGWKVLVSVKALHMNPEYFPEPEKFDPSRFERNDPLPNTYMPFGAGPNMCVGQNFAEAMMVIFIHNVVTRFKWELMLDSDEPVILDPSPSPASGVPIRLYPHPCQSAN